jgi:non-lysosomal glucosylceramidase
MPSCDDASCNCYSQFSRRRLFKLAGGLSVGAVFSTEHAFAGPFRTERIVSEVPIDKKLSPSWVKSLFERGHPEEVRGDALAHIGMPVGGICAGMVYLGGDGKLWHWDIFNQNKFGVTQTPVTYEGRTLSAGDGAAYVKPIPPVSEIHQGFWISIDGDKKALDETDWSDVRFVGEYPVGRISYRDSRTQVRVSLQSFSPFIPLNEEDSGLPITLMTYRVENGESRRVDVQIGGYLSNPVAQFSSLPEEVERFAEPLVLVGATGLLFQARKKDAEKVFRPDLDLESWSQSTYVGWKVEGTAFGNGPVLREEVPSYQGDLGGTGKRVVNSHASAPGKDVATRDSATGKLTGPDFKIERKFLNFLIGGGNLPGQTGMDLIVEGKKVRSSTGNNANRMQEKSWPVADLIGKIAHLVIVDGAVGPWGNVGIGEIWQSDRSSNGIDLEDRPDFGSLALAVFALGEANSADEVDSQPTGTVTVTKSLEPGEFAEVTFAVAWYFPNLTLGIPDDVTGRYYGKKFKDAADVVRYTFENRLRLMNETLLWNRTWYEGTLPHWFLNRTFANVSTLATTTAHRFGSGRFYAWEGIGCCAGTCTHVWHYAQGMGRLFPAYERDLRERVDYGIAFNTQTGGIGFRAEFDSTSAVDGQAGVLLRTYREHSMSADIEFLRRVWPRAKQAMLFLMGLDPHGEGILSGPQENTLDAAWFGKIAWTSSLYNAALRACERMADEVQDAPFALQCRDLADRGKTSLESQLYNGEYFVQTHDKLHPDALGTYSGCHIDQVMGQSWACQLGTERVLGKEKTLSALKALYKYNFTPNVGPFRDRHPEGRWYAMPGDGGMIMVTNPHADPVPYGDSKAWQFGYFNECMSGFEHQVASHMIAEGMVMEGLVVTRAIHDRYQAELRNPYNEIECSDHYARAMASYGSFISACGFEVHGPSGFIGFDPKIGPERFKAAFTAPEGWGTYEQKRRPDRFEASLTLRWGVLKLLSIKLNPDFEVLGHSEVRHGTRTVDHSVNLEGGFAVVNLNALETLHQDSELTLVLTR